MFLSELEELQDILDTLVFEDEPGIFNEEEVTLLTAFLKDSLDKKKLSRVKDVIYDKNNGTIKEIPALVYTKSSKHFTLKNMDKRVSTLKSLAPKKAHGTIKNKIVEKEDDSDSNDEN